MTQEDKKLLLTDLCARLPYGVMILHEDMEGRKVTAKLAGYDGGIWCDYYIDNLCYHLKLHEFKPYLRSMSSMTEDEKRELQSFYPGSFGGQWLDTEKGTIEIFECSSTITLYLNDSQRIVDWLNKNMFDYRGLIPKGFALEASEGMYKID